MAIERDMGGAGVTAEQRNAVEEAMRIILEDDRQRGDNAGTFECAACARQMAQTGSILYAEQRLCHGCATRFELARLERRVRTCGEYVKNVRGSRH